MGTSTAIASLTSLAPVCWREQVCFSRNQEIMSSGLLRGRVGLIAVGMALRQRRVRRTEVQAIDVLLPGDLVGIDSAMLGQTPTELKALSQLVVAVADVATFKRALGGSAFSEIVVSVLAQQQFRLENRIVRLGRLHADQRLAAFLLDIHDRLAKQEDGPIDLPSLALTQRDLANLLGLSPIHVNRVLNKLRSENILSFRRGAFTIIDRVSLRRIACEDGAINPIRIGL